jgi:TonB family protein
MPTSPKPASDAADKPEPPPTPLLDVPAQMLGASDLTAMGLVEAGADSLSRGPGSGDGAGPGQGTGSGPGTGDGLGPGEGGNTGGRVYRPGADVSTPVPVYRQQPRYTIQAMRARVEGEVMVQCVVAPSGECTQLRVLRSLDARLGLDEEALRAAAAWRFSPGMRQGKAVPVLVTILVGFSIR